MDKSIGVGLIVGLLIATTLYVYNTDRFNKIQKGILYICIIFPPAQWLLILIFLGINYTIKENSKERKEEKVIEKESTNHSDKLQTLKELHEQGILTDEEYYEKSAKLKAEKLQTELKLTEEYKKLKSLYDDGILTKEEFDKKVEKINIFSNGNNLSEKGKQRIKELVYEKINFKDYKEILNHFNKNDKINKALKDKLEKVLKIKTNLSDEKFIELIIKYLEEKFNQ